MKNRLNTYCAAVFITLILIHTFPALAANAAFPPPKTFVAIGTGSLSSTYYATVKAICDLVNKTDIAERIFCSAEPTAGSVENLRLIAENQLEMALVQTDNLQQAYTLNHKLRLIFSLFPEAFTVIATANSGIHKFSDIKGKKINIGPTGSGYRQTTETLFSALNWPLSDFAKIRSFPFSRQPYYQPHFQPHSMCSGKVDAFIVMDSLPSGLTQEATISCHNRIIPVAGPEIEKFLKTSPVYRPLIIPGNLYRRVAAPVKTFGVLTALVTSTDTPVSVVHDITKTIFENFNQFKSRHPALQILDKQVMIGNNSTIPMHNGALNYYHEAELIPKGKAKP